MEAEDQLPVRSTVLQWKWATSLSWLIS